jgi:hypothetical protein
VRQDIYVLDYDTISSKFHKRWKRRNGEETVGEAAEVALVATLK